PDASSKFTVGQQLTGKVVRKEVYGLFVELEPGVSGLLHKSRTFDHPEFRLEKVRVGDEIAVQVVEIKAAERQIALSLPGGDAGGDAEWKAHQAKQAPASSFGTLADQFKAAMTKKK
ncbi:MAG: S1 RNA-binding domain-containing protein, partial [Proteobacteria bacterium]